MADDTGHPPLRQFSHGLSELMATRPVFGVFLVSGSAMIAEAAAHTGIDWAVVDMEAAAMTKADALHQLQALAGPGVPSIIRVPRLDRHELEFALDLGASGVMVPKVDRPEDAELVARFTRYPQLGARGVNPIRANAYYSRSAEYFATANQAILCIAQIESREAVANADKIAATVGVDMLFIGANDLAMDLGQPGDMSGPAFEAARRDVLAACAAAGKPVSIFAYSTKLARQYVTEGFRFIAVGNEIKFFVQSATVAVSMARK